MSKTAWSDVQLPRVGKLKKAGHYDVVVVGGGITGLSAAYFLKQAGKTVCLLERDRLASGDTACTTAHLTSVTDKRLSDLASQFSKEEAALVWHAGTLAIDTIEAIVDELNIDCQFKRVPGFLHAPLRVRHDDETDKDEPEENNTHEEEAAVKQFRAEAALAEELGIPAQFLAEVPLVNRPGIRFAHQAKFHPLAYLARLAEAVDGDGCDIFEQSEVTEIEGDPPAVLCNGHRIECEHVVIATHVPLMGKTGLVGATLFQSKLSAYTSYALRAKLPVGMIPEASFWDTSNPYYYLRIDDGDDADYVIFGGEDHKTGQVTETQQCFDRLERALHSVLPRAQVDRRWSGQVIETNDGLPLIGDIAERQFIATGFAGNGMTFGTLAGLMARDAVLKRDNPWQELFSPDRKKIRGGTWRYLKENVDFPFYFLCDRLAPAEAESTRAVGRGEGMVLKIDGEHVACSRDKDGKLTQVSAVCTHMGCLVRWNGAEESWDCPCHGSRFKPDGKVIAGPAETPLEPIGKMKATPKKAVSAPARRNRSRTRASGAARRGSSHPK